MTPGNNALPATFIIGSFITGTNATYFTPNQLDQRQRALNFTTGNNSNSGSQYERSCRTLQ